MQFMQLRLVIACAKMISQYENIHNDTDNDTLCDKDNFKLKFVIFYIREELPIMLSAGSENITCC